MSVKTPQPPPEAEAPSPVGIVPPPPRTSCIPDESWKTAPCCECARPVLMWPVGFKVLSPILTFAECPWCHMILNIHWAAGKTTKRGVR